MANKLGVNPWVVDTAGGGVLYSGYMEIDHFEFADYNVDTDNVLVQDANGNRLWDENGASDLRSLASGKIGFVKGIQVPTLAAGRLFIFVK